MAAIPAFGEAHLQRVCDILADTSAGLTGSEMGRLLRQLGIADPEPTVTKRHRLFAALKARQGQDRCGNNVAAFIQAAMEPVRYTGNRAAFDSRRNELNEVLAFCGFSLGEDGKLRASAAVSTLSEAEERAGRLRAELRRRGVHADVLAFCRAELLQANYFHAVFEATKSVADKIRVKSGLSGDGSELVDQAFGSGKAGMPYLAFNALQTETERSEHSGLMNLMKGMFGTLAVPGKAWPGQGAAGLRSVSWWVEVRLPMAVCLGAALWGCAAEAQRRPGHPPISTVEIEGGGEAFVYLVSGVPAREVIGRDIFEPLSPGITPEQASAKVGPPANVEREGNDSVAYYDVSGHRVAVVTRQIAIAPAAGSARKPSYELRTFPPSGYADKLPTSLRDVVLKEPGVFRIVLVSDVADDWNVRLMLRGGRLEYVQASPKVD